MINFTCDGCGKNITYSERYGIEFHGKYSGFKERDYCKTCGKGLLEWKIENKNRKRDKK